MDHLPMPKFGPLAGLRVVFSGIEIAGPFAGQMFAEWGAEVIWIENVAWADTIRVQPNYPQLSRRNLHALSLNIFKDEGREAFLKLMETTDIFIEASKGPAFARRGITDEVLWQHNPKLVIAHLSGFGQYGTEEYTNLPAYNTIAQAFSGYLIQNGDVDQPMPAFPYTADYFSGLTATTAALAALHKARETGKGESIDIAMYEVMLRMGQYFMMDYFNGGENVPAHEQR
ncbi:crotonobetainyl-CoA:carnitine CoA-transferase [Escherichia coli]|uniref:Crotonobetainyl-CoA:carnitine CoA-transferase n=1 Tax=Escherichia coli TaxID=562 RepID=A0A377CWP8_ECOLX|nr:crotonobetainyl-CoA:carnitine CoA-transferase [Escherichia coli]